MTVLDEKEIQMIDEVSRKVLTNIGIFVPNDNVLKQLSEKGADVDFDSKIVKVSNKIIDECLDKAPEIIKIYNRDFERHIEIGKGKKTYVASGHNAIYYFDEEKGEKRPITKKEVGNFALISDYLDEIDVVGVQAMPQDVNSNQQFFMPWMLC